MLSKYPDKSASTTSVCPVLSSRSTWRTASKATALRAVGVLFRLQIGLEDWLQDQHCSHLNHAIFYARNSERPELAITFRYEHASDRSGTIRLVPEFFRQFVQPPFFSIRLDVRKALAVDPRCAAISKATDEGPLQDVSAVQLVVQARRTGSRASSSLWCAAPSVTSQP